MNKPNLSVALSPSEVREQRLRALQPLRTQGYNSRFCIEDMEAIREARERGCRWEQIGEMLYPESTSSPKSEKARSLYYSLRHRFGVLPPERKSNGNSSK